MNVIEAYEDNSILFKKYIVLILTYIYENIPSAVRFDINLAEKLTGYDYKTENSEKNIVKFFETIDWLNREGYVRCSHFYIKFGSTSDMKTLQSSIPVFISEKGIRKLESTYDNKETFIGKFKEYALKLTGKVADKTATGMVTIGIDSLLAHFFK